MSKSCINGLVVALALLIAACEPRIRQTPIEDAASWDDIVPLNTMIQISEDGAPVDLNTVLASEETVRQALDTLFPRSAGTDNLRQRIEEIRGGKSGDRPPELLRGLGGLYAHEFLNSVEATLGRNGNFDPDKRVYEFFYGHTREFAFNERAGTGRILNFTYFTRVVVTGDNDPIITTTDSYRWAVRVAEGGFSVIEKDDSDPNDPFPGTLEFSPEILNRVDALGFEYKLWAKGTSIIIEDIAFKGDGDPTYVSLPTSDPRYDRTDSNCIDMMFVNFPPPTLGTLQPPLYCLGRCDNPMLINTGL